MFYHLEITGIYFPYLGCLCPLTLCCPLTVLLGVLSSPLPSHALSMCALLPHYPVISPVNCAPFGHCNPTSWHPSPPTLCSSPASPSFSYHHPGPRLSHLLIARSPVSGCLSLLKCYICAILQLMHVPLSTENAMGMSTGIWGLPNPERTLTHYTHERNRCGNAQITHSILAESFS